MRSIRATIALWRRRFGRVLEDVSGLTVRWSDQKGKHPAHPWIELSLLAPPAARSVAVPQTHTLTSQARVTFEGIDSAQERIVVVNGHYVRATASSDAAMATAMAQALNDSPEPVSATALGTSVTVDRETVGDLRSILTIGGTLEILDTELVEVFEAPAGASVSMNIYSLDGAGELAAGGLMAELLHELKAPAAIEAFRQADCAVGVSGSPRDLSFLEGGEIESRAQVELPISLTLRRARAIDPVERVAITTGHNGGQFEVQQEA